MSHADFDSQRFLRTTAVRHKDSFGGGAKKWRRKKNDNW
jgi:hypothetical protein